LFCTTCGTANVDSARFCVHCGTPVGAAPTVVVSPQAIMAAAAPAAQPTTLSAAPSPYYPPPPGTAMPQTSGKAVASMVVALSNLLFFFLFFPLAIVAVILGHISRGEIRKSGGRVTGNGFAMTGLIVGYGSLAFCVLLVGAAIVVPAFIGARGSGAGLSGENAALNSMRALVVATATYDAQFGKGYPASLAAMGAGPGDTGEGGSGMIDHELATGEKDGYRFQYTPLDLNSDGYIEAFTLTADPAGVSMMSGRHFYVDQTGVIRVENDHMATADSPQLE
jgi:hypothetical protein